MTTQDQLGQLSRRIQALPPEKRAQFLRRLEEEGGQFNLFPLSFAQERLWLTDQLEPGNPAYNLPAALRLTGELDARVLERAFEDVVRRHEMLRTSFPVVYGRPFQFIGPAESFSLPVTDLSGLAPGASEREVGRLAAEEARRSFDLAKGGLLRARLLKVSEREHVLLLTMHHIVGDAWSSHILVRELTTLYGAYSRGDSSPLAEPAVQYADFSAWQRKSLRGDALEGLLAYWRQRLADAPPVLELPTDRPRPQVRSFRGATEDFSVPAATYKALQELSRREGATLFMTLLAAFKLLLARYSGQTDIVTGTPIAGRTRGETEPLIGFFVNTLVLRTDLSGDPTFRELLARVRETCLGAFAHQELPFDKLVEELNPARSAGQTPLFQFMFSLQNTPKARLSLDGLTLDVLELEYGTAKFDLVQNFIETEEGLAGNVHFNTDIFERETVARMLGHFLTLLDGVAADPDRRVSSLPVLRDEERARLLRDFNETNADYPHDSTFTRLFERQAEHTPDSVAAVSGDRQVTYGQLNAGANRLARLLVGEGVGADAVVALLAGRDIELLTSILATFKAGGAYLPLAPKDPPRRLSQILTQSRAAVLVTTHELAAGARQALAELPEAARPRLIVYGQEDEPDFAPAAENLPARSGPRDLAYVIYTSGSTGVPKGAMIEHRGMLNHLYAKVYALGLSAADVVAETASQCFDISVWQFLAALLVGGRVEIFDDETAHNGTRLLAAAARRGVTILESVPALVGAMLDERERRQVSARELRALRRLLVTGEALPPETCRRWFARYDTPLMNAYGPTECSDDVTHHVITEAPAPEARQVPIGRPVINTQLYVLDANLEPVPFGARGELYVGGIGVGRGYLGDGARTAEVFLPNPFCAEPGGRLYKTGDAAKYLPDGTLQYLGRVDTQVKVHGFRIELGEVDAALRAHAQVREAAVVAREDSRGGKRLVAYVVPRVAGTAEGGAGESDARGTVPAKELEPRLRAHLAERLPDYMVPSAFVLLDSLPLTPNGKVDTRALPEPEAVRPESGKEFVAPSTPLEKYLAEKWCEVLGLKVIGVNDNFFELGGDSIEAAILVNRLQEELDEILYVVTIFDTPTVGRFADYLLRNYRAAVGRLPGVAAPEPEAGNEAPRAAVVNVESVRRMRESITPLPPRAGEGAKNRPAVFVLSPPRSGSTLLRVMLGGHPRLFAPPELELLGFDTLRERRDCFEGRNSFLLEGAVRAVMGARACDARQARELIEEFEREGMPVKEFYARLQGWLGGRTLVDKTPSYSLDLSVLRRAEQDFEGPLYIHLLRHPLAMIRSFEEAKIHQIYPRQQHSFEAREAAELIWLISQQNILEFLRGIPESRRLVVRFEELVADPRRVMERACEFLSITFDPQMLEVYAERSRRMTDALHEAGHMLGDVKFHKHRKIEAGVGERWRREGEPPVALSEDTWSLAAELGYERPAARSLTPVETLARPSDGRPALFPASFAQERLWFLSRLVPDSPFYNLSKALRLSGRLDVEALRQTLAEVTRRHEVLRTSFVEVEGRPMQLVSPSSEPRLAMLDLRHLPADEREAEARRVAARDALLAFDLAAGPLLRTMLMRLDDEEHVCVLTMHHIVSDGWSMGVLTREATALYAAFSSGEAPSLEPLPFQYADFAAWQKRELRGETLERQLSYWRKQLAGQPAAQNLPTTYERPREMNYSGASLPFELSSELSRRLVELSRREGVTLFMTLLAALLALLSRYTGQTDISVGTDVAGRGREGLGGIIGFFINILVLRTDLSGDPTFRELLGRVRETCLGAYAHQDIPFDKLVGELRSALGGRAAQPFQVLFVLQNTPRETLSLPGVTISPVEVKDGMTKFDLVLFVGETGRGIAGSWKYSTELFDGEAVARMSGHFNKLLEGIAAEPDSALSSIEMGAEEERLRQADERRRREEARRKRFKGIRPRAVSLPRGEPVKTGFLPGAEGFPLVIEPATADFDLADWAGNSHAFIEEKLRGHGALLFRGFDVRSASGLEGFASTICPELFGDYGDLPREGAGGNVYGSTPYPAEQAILFHNESSHLHRWPMKIWFLCLKAAERGGETPIVDCRKVYDLLDPSLRDRFAREGVMYVRNFTDGLDVSWSDFFRTHDRAAVEEVCRRTGVEFEWKASGGLRMRQVRPAVARHPKTGETVFFNQLSLHHVSCLGADVGAALRSLFSEEDLPRNVYYGDGSPIEDSVVDEIRDIQERAAVRFPWREGDVLMLDNMLAAHARSPYVGARKVVVALGEMMSADGL